MTDVQLPFNDPPDGYALELTRQSGAWRVVARTHDSLGSGWTVVLTIERAGWSDALEAAYTTLWGFGEKRR